MAWHYNDVVIVAQGCKTKGFRQPWFKALNMRRYFIVEILGTNQVQGLYCKLLTEFFPVGLWSEHEVHKP